MYFRDTERPFSVQAPLGLRSGSAPALKSHSSSADRRSIRKIITAIKVRVQTDRFRRQTLRTPQRRAGCALEDALVCASGDAPVARRETRRSARRQTRRSARRETRCSARRETRCSARRKTRRLRAGRRAEYTPCARAGPSVPFRGGGRCIEVVIRRGRRVADGAASPGRLGRGAFSLPWQPRGVRSTQHLSQSRGALKLPRSRASCSDRLSLEMSSSFVERDAEEANGEAENAERGRTQSS